EVIIVPIAAHKGGVIEKAKEIEDMLVKAGVRAETDVRDMSPGWKFNEWEMKGVPVRIEIGPRDIENNQVLVMRRDTLEKQAVSIDQLGEQIPALLDVIQKDMLVKSRANRDKKIVTADSLDGILAGVEGKNFVKAGWCGCRECEDKVKETASATARVICDEDGVPEKCAICGKPAKHNVIFARAY
ncbi:MAG: proline--tRNA ligase, partial [Clostridia bacterium]|nr:proline--tRNA ligase [Clostridia bacterium]